MEHLYSIEDDKFKQQVEGCSIAVSEFNHRAHVRLAYIYLVKNSTDSSNHLMRETINKLLKYNNIEPSVKYHETLTKAWLLAVSHYMQNTESSFSADDFINENPQLLDNELIMRHYSKQRLYSDNARNKYMEPDLAPIP